MKTTTVCGNLVSIFTRKNENEKWKLLRVRRFPHHGAARLFSIEFDDAEKQKQAENAAA